MRRWERHRGREVNLVGMAWQFQSSCLKKVLVMHKIPAPEPESAARANSVSRGQTSPAWTCSDSALNSVVVKEHTRHNFNPFDINIASILFFFSSDYRLHFSSL